MAMILCEALHNSQHEGVTTASEGSGGLCLVACGHHKASTVALKIQTALVKGDMISNVPHSSRRAIRGLTCRMERPWVFQLESGGGAIQLASSYPHDPGGHTGDRRNEEYEFRYRQYPGATH